MAVWESDSKDVVQTMSLPGNASVRNLSFSRDGLYLLVCGSDRFVRLLDFLTNPVSLTFRRDFQDVVNRQVWKCGCLSGNSDYLAAAITSKDQHKIYIWNSFGQLVTFLEGQKEGVEQIYWHPYLPLIIVITNLGFVRFWVKKLSENWSAFAPNFEVLEENVVYEEREDEFDAKPEDDDSAAQSRQLEDIDIISKLPQPIFSDDEEDDPDVLKYLPIVPVPDSEQVKQAVQQISASEIGSSTGMSSKRRSRSRSISEFQVNKGTNSGVRNNKRKRTAK
jgi:COMPASS component SWD1